MPNSAFAREVDQAASLRVIGGTVLGVWAAFHLVRPWWNPTTDAFVAVPVLYALAVTGAALTVLLLGVRVRTLDNARLRWMICGLAIAGTAALFQGVVIADLADVPELTTPSGAVALYWLWHGSLVTFALGGALAPTRRRLRRALTLAGVALLCIVLFEPTWDVLPAIVASDTTLTPIYRPITAILSLATLGAAGVWVAAGGRRTTRPDVWVVILLILAGLDLAYGLRAGSWPEFVWWNSAPLRAAQFVAPAVGLLIDNARMVELLRRHERGLHAQLRRELELATRELRPPAADAEAAARIRGVLAHGDYTSVFQPIVSLGSGQVLAVEALTRFTAAPARTPDRWFDEAHAVGLGVELELAAMRSAVRAARDLPPEVAVSLNVSPMTLADPRLLGFLDEFGRRTPLMMEITEHTAIADYAQLDGPLASLRRRGVRVAIDDAGAGFASLRHVVRLGPDLIKLDMSLTRGVDHDPVRQALAESLTAFTRRTGTTMIAEGVEQPAELAVLHGLGVDAAQGYLLCRPVPIGDVPLSVPAARTRSATPRSA